MSYRRVVDGSRIRGGTSRHSIAVSVKKSLIACCTVNDMLPENCTTISNEYRARATVNDDSPKPLSQPFLDRKSVV